MKPKILVILGPTATGKSDIAVKIAKKFSAYGGSAAGRNGAEIISANSRQVYKGMNLGSGKITKREMLGIPHHLFEWQNQILFFPFRNIKNWQKKPLKRLLKKINCLSSSAYGILY